MTIEIEDRRGILAEVTSQIADININVRKVEAIADFLGLDSFELRNVNVGTEKDYVKAYRAFQQGVSFPDEYITLMCETKYFTHFYSDEVVEATRRKWAKT